jgi:hypothetical protein
MNLEKILAENMLRFGVKNLSNVDKSAILTEQVEPNLSAADWSKGGTVTWANADVTDIVEYIYARDADQPYKNFAVYEPVMQWFASHGSDTRTKASLMIWCGDDPYYGLPKSREKAQEGGYTAVDPTADQTPRSAFGTRELAKEWQIAIDALKGTSPTDKQVKAHMQLYVTALEKAAAAGLSVNTLNGPGYWKSGKGELQYLPNGGYTAADVIQAKSNAIAFVKKLNTNAKGTMVSQDSDANLTLVKANNINRTKLLTSLDSQVRYKAQNPIFRDRIRNQKGKDDIPYVISKAWLIQFTKSDMSSNAATKDAPGSVDTIVYVNYSWPDPNTMDQAAMDNQAQTFFPDDGIIIGGNADTGMNRITDKIFNEIRDAKEKYGESFKVISIAINTTATTSKVNTSFGTGLRGTAKKWSPENNIALVKARFANMQSVMTDKLKSGLKNQTDGAEESVLNKIVAGTQQNFANSGPAWTEVGGKAYEQEYTIANYGPLFQAAYAKDPTLTPQEFYSPEARKTPAIKADYEQSFAGYRKAWITVTITMQGADAPDAPEGDVVIAISGNMEASIHWPDNRKDVKYKKSKKSHRSRMPINTIPIFTGSGTKCNPPR